MMMLEDADYRDSVLNIIKKPEDECGARGGGDR